MSDESLKETACHLLRGFVWLQNYSKDYAHTTDGVTMIDPSSVWIDERAVVGKGTIIFPNVLIRGKTSIGTNCVLDVNSVIEWSRFGDNIYIGPFAQIKRTTINNNSLVPHRCYLGDAEIGEDVNIGASVDTGNFDGFKKNKTIIKDGAFIGIQVKFIAQPNGLVIGKEARIFPGQTIQVNIPDHAFVTPQVRDGIVREKIRENRSFKIPGHWKWFKTKEPANPANVKLLFEEIKELFGEALPWLTSPQIFLQNKTPLEIIIQHGDEGIKMIRECIYAMPI